MSPRPRFTVYTPRCDGVSSEAEIARALSVALAERGGSVRLVSLLAGDGARAGRTMEAGIEVLRCPPLTRGVSMARPLTALATRLGLDRAAQALLEPIPSVHVWRSIGATSQREVVLAVGPGNALFRGLRDEAVRMVVVASTGPTRADPPWVRVTDTLLVPPGAGDAWRALCPATTVVEGSSEAHAAWAFTAWREEFDPR